MTGKVLTSWSLVWLLATVLFVVGGALNLSQRAYHKLPPTDGVIWQLKDDGGIYAEKVLPGFAASRAGVSAGDRLVGIELEGQKNQEITSPADVQMYLEAAGVDGSLTYSIIKPYSFVNNEYYADLKHIDTQARWTAPVIFLTFVGIVWLGVGIFVLFKQGGHAPFVLHFANICLAAFVFHVYKPLYLGEDFDFAIGLLDNLAFSFFAPLFLHFCLRYPVRNEVFDNSRWQTVLLYVPASLITVGIFVFTIISQLAPKLYFVELITPVIDKFDLIANLYLANFYHFVIFIAAGAGI